MSYYSKGSSSGFHEIALPASKKTHSEKNKQILKQLLKEESNKNAQTVKPRHILGGLLGAWDALFVLDVVEYIGAWVLISRKLNLLT